MTEVVNISGGVSMRFQIKCQKLASLLLASCAFSGSLHFTSIAEGADGGASGPIEQAQQTGLIEIATKPNFGGVTTASGVEIAGRRSSRTGPRTAGVLVAQPPKNLPQVPLPAVTGPVELNNQADDGKKSENSLTPIQNRELTTNVHVVDMSVTGLGTGTIPAAAFDKRLAEATHERFAAQKCVYWHPSSICHFPLRYEEAMLERHGHVRLGRLQPLVSGVRFFTTIPMLPYLNTLQPYYQPVYALG
ncbi:MAG: hypothetical protein KDA51_05465, partial [Planctomycetales bacterium]|nr:hypothetical protein [Planctomycetales bacterium]